MLFVSDDWQPADGSGALAAIEEAHPNVVAATSAVRTGGTEPSGESGGLVASRSVGEWLKLSRDDLKEWAGREGSSLKLPELILRLVEETTPEGTRVDFPSGTGVLSGGWDGLVECRSAHRYVPMGRSGWELSMDKNSNRKALSDYENRCSKVSERDRAEMTYVQVICRPWIDASNSRRERPRRGGSATCGR